MSDPLVDRIQSAEFYLGEANRYVASDLQNPAQYFATLAVAELLLGIAEAFKPYELRQTVQLIRQQAKQREEAREHGPT